MAPSPKARPLPDSEPKPECAVRNTCDGFGHASGSTDVHRQRGRGNMHRRMDRAREVQYQHKGIAIASTEAVPSET